MSIKSEIILAIKTMGAEEASKKVKGIEKDGKKASNQWKDLSTHLNKSISIYGKIATAAAAAGTAIVLFAKSGIDDIDAQIKKARDYQLTLEELATLERAGGLAGVSIEEIDKIVKALTINLGKDTAAGLMKDIGLSISDLDKMGASDKLLAINKAIKDNIPASQQAATAAEIYGAKLGFVATRLDADTIKQANEEAKLFGVALGGLNTKAIELAADSFSKIDLAAEGAHKQISSGLAPVLYALGETTEDTVAKFGGMENIASKITPILKFVLELIMEIFLTPMDMADGLYRVFIITFNGLSKLWWEYVATVSKGTSFILEALNKIPGVDLTGAVKELEIGIAGAEKLADEASENITKALTEPLVGDAIRNGMEQHAADWEKLNKKKVDDAKKAGDKQEAEIRNRSQTEIDAERKKQEELLKIRQQYQNDINQYIKDNSLSGFAKEAKAQADDIVDKLMKAEALVATSTGSEKAIAEKKLEELNGLLEVLMVRLTQRTKLETFNNTATVSGITAGITNRPEDMLAANAAEQRAALADEYAKINADYNAFYQMRVLGAGKNSEELEEIRTTHISNLAQLMEWQKKRELEIEQEKNDAIKKIQLDRIRTTLSIYQMGLNDLQTFQQGLMDMQEAYDKKSSTRQRNAWFAQQSLAHGIAAMNVAVAISNAMADWGAGNTATRFALAAAVAAAGGQQLSVIANTKYPGRAQGGQMGSDSTYLVGEKGPELIHMGTTGRAYNNADTKALMNGSGNPTGVTIINNTTGRIDEVEQKQNEQGELIFVIRETMKRDLNNPNSDFRKGLNNNFSMQRKF